MHKKLFILLNYILKTFRGEVVFFIGSIKIIKTEFLIRVSLCASEATK